MNFKKRIIALCMLLSLSFLTPDVSVIPAGIATPQSTSVVLAKCHSHDSCSNKVSVKKKKKKKKTGNKAKKEAQVYVTATGECYHTHACGRGNYYKDSLSAACARGLRKCKKCYG